MGKPYHKIIFSYIKMILGSICYFLRFGKSKGHFRFGLRIKDYIDFDEISEIQEEYENKKVMNTALDSLKNDYEENKMMNRLITERKRSNYKYKDDSAKMDSL